MYFAVLNDTLICEMYLLAPDEPHKGETGPCRAINMFYTLIV